KVSTAAFALRVLRRPSLDQLLQRNELRGIDTGVARSAVCSLFAFGAGLAQALEGEIGQGIRADVAADLIHSLVGGDELALYRSIDTVVARRDGGRAGDTHVHRGGPGVAHHTHDLAAGCAAHDGVVNQHHTLACQDAAYRVQLELHAEVSYPLFGFDEGTAN